MILYAIISWYFQNFLAVLSFDALLVPDIFLLYIIYNMLSDFSKDIGNEVLLIWVLFFGGIIWDLRWTEIPGIFASVYIGTFLCASWVWSLFPESGHTTSVLFIILWFSQLPGFFAGLYLWDIGAEYYLTSLLIWLAYSIPLSAIFSLLYVRKLKLKNA